VDIFSSDVKLIEGYVYAVVTTDYCTEYTPDTVGSTGRRQKKKSSKFFENGAVQLQYWEQVIISYSSWEMVLEKKNCRNSMNSSNLEVSRIITALCMNKFRMD
jgi:hypothetical protein